MIFKPLTREEYDRLTLQERLDYLKRLQDDIAERMSESRRQLEETQKRLTDTGH